MKIQSVASRRLSYIDFLLPGVLSLAIMQSGIFGVAFGFVSLRKRGVLRRLSVTPIDPQDFIVAQVAMRLIVLLAQIVVLLSVGVLFFDIQFMGSLLNLLIVGLLGGAVFLAIGFSLAGIAKTEDQVAPLANVVSLPMMLLSGSLLQPLKSAGAGSGGHRVLSTHLSGRWHEKHCAGRFNPLRCRVPTGRPRFLVSALRLGSCEGFPMGISLECRF